MKSLVKLFMTVAAFMSLSLPVGAETLTPGDAINGPEARHELVHQSDGNVVLYNEFDQALWHTKTHGRDTSHLVMQADGNLVLYSPSNQPLWHSGSHGNPGATLKVQSDGNVVIYKSNGSVAWAIKHWPPRPPAPAVEPYGVWDRLRLCEAPDWAGGWTANTGNGYYGGLQFSLSSWRGVGGTGYPHQHSRSEQIKRGKLLLAAQGWVAWPKCSRQLGLR